MSYTNQVKIDSLRSVAFGSITGSYTAVGSALANPARIVCFTNTTDTDMLVSTNGSTDQLVVVSGGFKLFDLTTNHRPINQDDFCFSIGTQFYVKYASAPSSGTFYIENIYAQTTNAPDLGY